MRSAREYSLATTCKHGQDGRLRCREAAFLAGERLATERIVAAMRQDVAAFRSLADEFKSSAKMSEYADVIEQLADRYEREHDEACAAEEAPKV